MKNILPVLLTLCFCSTLSAQREDDKQKAALKHEIGISATTLVQQFISGDDSTASPYLLSYRAIKGKYALRFGIGGTSKRNRRSEEGFADSETISNYSLDVRLGLEYRSNFGRRLVGIFGLDIIGSFGTDKEVIDSGFDEVTVSNVRSGIGFGPVLGLQYRVTDQFSIGTEGSFYYLFSKETENRIFKNFPQFDDQINHFDKQDLLITLPATLYLLFRF